MFWFLFAIFFTLLFGILCIGFIVTSIQCKSFENWFPMLIAMILFIVCICGWIMEPPSIYRSCCGIIEWNVFPENFCENCGSELISHCVDCGRVCYSSFCSACGAEQ